MSSILDRNRRPRNDDDVPEPNFPTPRYSSKPRKYAGASNIATLLNVLSFVTITGAIVGGVLLFFQQGAGIGVQTLAASVCIGGIATAALLGGAALGLRMLADMAGDSKRTADAIEDMAARRR